MSTYTFRGIQVPVGGAATITDQTDGTASRLTNVTTQLEETTSSPDIELNQALITRVRGIYSVQPDDLTLRFYSFGLIIAPSTLDAADIDPGIQGGQGFNWWLLNRRIITGTSTNSEDITPEVRAVTGSYRTSGMRKLRGFGMALWLVEKVDGNDLDNAVHLMDITVARRA